MPVFTDDQQMRQFVAATVQSTPVFDVHTHLYPPSFGPLGLWGIDELVTYHYLIAEVFRFSSATPAAYWALSKKAQADLIWENIFIKHTPVSEAARGVVKVIKEFGFDPAARDLSEVRRFFAAQEPLPHAERVMDMAGVSDLVMTNDPFNSQEAAMWKGNMPRHPRFHAALRMDPLINDLAHSYKQLQAEGYEVDARLSGRSVAEARRFLDDWITRMQPLYMAVSLPPDLTYGDDSLRSRVIHDVVLPTAAAHRLPFAMMIGVIKRANPVLRDAGDSLGHANIRVLERFCVENPGVRFLVSMLSRENQHELCVSARKFANLMPFGCWWFLNNPSIVAEITSERLELLGTSFIPQHSDARILEQMVYKWAHSRHVISNCLVEAYAALRHDGYPLASEQVQHDIERLFQGNFREWVHLPPATK
jgi:hypothetical protein